MSLRLKGAIIFLSIVFVSEFSYAGFLEERYLKDVVVSTINRKLLKIDREGEFRVYFINKYGFPLENLELKGESQFFDIKITPLSLSELLPEEPRFFLIKLRLKNNYPAGSYKLYLNLCTNQYQDFERGIKEPILVRDEEFKGVTQAFKGRAENDTVNFPLGEFVIVVDKNLNLKAFLYFGIITFIIFILFVRTKFSK